MDQSKQHKTSKPKKSHSFIKKVSAIMTLILLIPVVIGIYFYNEYTNALTEANSDSSEQTNFIVTEGESAESISLRLVENGLLKRENRNYFLIYLKRSGEGNKLQAGEFRIPKNLSIKELATTLQNAGIPDLWVTIPEGLRKDQIATILADAYSQYTNAQFNKEQFLTLTTDQQFINSLELLYNPTDLEGYLFPDKYLLPVEATSEYVVNTMVGTFKSKVGSQYTYEDIVIASMIEREGRSDEERKMISDIIHKRLNEGWFLSIDATLLYYFKDWEHQLTFADLEMDQPYNTYTNLGTPPTPICNPGLSAIEASLEPTPNNYYYYLHDNTGQIHYARTLSEHNLNIETYL